jgi:type II secretory pathway pseudopilin PulG
MFIRFKNHGFSLIEALFSIAILSIVLPIVINALIKTQFFLQSSNVDAELELEANTTMQHIISDIKESVAIFDQKTDNISTFKDTFLNDSVIGTQFTDKQGNDCSSILLMKFAGEKILSSDMGGKRISQYHLVTYYMQLTPTSSLSYDKFQKLRSIVRLESEQTLIDPTPLNDNERSITQTKGYMFWLPQKKGYSPVMPPINQITFRKMKFTEDTAPDSIVVNSYVVPSTGGLVFSQKDNTISITLVSAKKTMVGLKKFLLKSQAVATSFIF